MWPVFDGTTWTTQPMTLRTYFYPSAPGSSQLTWSTPGATLRVRRATTPTSGDGDALKILLVNQLPAPLIPDSQCDAACPSGSNCCPPPGQPCPSTCTKGCPQETFPACFHGNNTTNLHFHGTHVSPQAPQDYVLLELAPAGTPASHAGHTRTRGVSGSGRYQYAINPFPSNQAEGTHWYHPHKHGSVSLQLLNGMGGALLIEGPFDDWLNGFYKPQGGLSEKVLVIQQLDDVLNFFRQHPTYAPPQPLINGQANPVVSMQPGEIQRWRLVNESMQASAQLQIGFENTSAPILKQIAQDGVQFAPQNYGNQPAPVAGCAELQPLARQPRGLPGASTFEARHPPPDLPSDRFSRARAQGACRLAPQGVAAETGSEKEPGGGRDGRCEPTAADGPGRR
ncbi:MAG: multicopper oxidase domain-containing protein [Gammaproteobacteria bacterium]